MCIVWSLVKLKHEIHYIYNIILFQNMFKTQMPYFKLFSSYVDILELG